MANFYDVSWGEKLQTSPGCQEGNMRQSQDLSLWFSDKAPPEATGHSTWWHDMWRKTVPKIHKAKGYCRERERETIENTIDQIDHSRGFELTRWVVLLFCSQVYCAAARLDLGEKKYEDTTQSGTSKLIRWFWFVFFSRCNHTGPPFLFNESLLDPFGVTHRIHGLRSCWANATRCIAARPWPL